MTTDGPFNFSAATALTGNPVGGQNWTGSSGILTSNNSYATCTLDDTQYSEYLKAYTLASYGTIADSDTVTSITIRVERKFVFNTGSRYCVDYSLRLVVGGTITGSDLADTVTKYPSADGTADYVFSGLSLTGAQFKASDFGCVLSCGPATLDTTPRAVSVDQILVQSVTYTIASMDVSQIMSAVQTTINAGLAASQVASTNSPIGVSPY